MPNSTNDIIRVAAHMRTVATGDIVNVFHYRLGTVADASDAQILEDLARVLDDMYQTIGGQLSSDVVFVDVNGFNVTDNHPMGSVPWPNIVAGSNGSNMLPSTVAAFLRATTGVSRNWAKKFIGGLTEDANTTGGVLGSGIMTALANFAVIWIASAAPASGNTYAPVVFHRASQMWLALTDIVIRNVWSQVRKRRIGRGS